MYEKVSWNCTDAYIITTETDTTTTVLKLLKIGSENQIGLLRSAVLRKRNL